ncbi:MAG: hypothetical protein JWP11_3314 [Frankiales bacterium]|nr:hypothetical protein [Frankiales bacterium]
MHLRTVRSPSAVIALTGLLAGGLGVALTTGSAAAASTGVVAISDQTHPLAGTNVPRLADQLVRYTLTATQRSTPTNQWGVELVVVRDKVSSVRDRQVTGAGPTRLPRGGFVLSGNGTARSWLLRSAPVGARVTLRDAATAPAPAASPAPTATQAPSAPAPVPTAGPASPSPAAVQPLVTADFNGPDGMFADSAAFWGSGDRGLAQNPSWFAESGSIQRRSSAGWANSPVFRMWTRRTDLAGARADLTVRFNGWAGGSEAWHGINLWMNYTLCTPFPGCSAVNDRGVGGNGGYALDFMNRDGSLTILKKVPGDTTATWPTGNVGASNGGTYYWLKNTTFTPQIGRTYRFSGRVIDNGNGSNTLQVLIDGVVRLEVLDDGRIGGPPQYGGRVGLRSDYADMTVDDFSVSK